MSNINHNFDAREDNAANTMPERRSASRVVPVLRVGKILTDDGERLCIIRNASSEGLMVQTPGLHKVGARVEVEAKSDLVLSGTIVWVNDDMIGVRFDGETDIQEILTTSTMPGSRRPRPPRLTISGQVRVRVGADYHRCELKDISQGGVKIEKGDLPIDEEAIIMLSGMQPVKASVRWNREGMTGLAFQKPIQFDALLRWLDANNKPGARAI